MTPSFGPFCPERYTHFGHNRYYSEDENAALADWLNRKAAAENLTLDAKVADPDGRFEKIHAKGVVIDREAVVVGSLNWNSNRNLLIHYELALG